jgi:hypothetical protein
MNHLLMAMREQVQNHSTFHQNIAKAMVDAHDEAALEMESFVDSKAKFKAFHRIIRRNVRKAETFHKGHNAANVRSNHHNTQMVTGFKVSTLVVSCSIDFHFSRTHRRAHALLNCQEASVASHTRLSTDTLTHVSF